ncbi:unnamed protein product [Angiostrongylus costaricensis]|uniref:SPOC domain-containing protein n=1 Tax=Angiostrongylus costaricensis TaxID=334426 RepID=A0A0R3PHD7_ANGCS|nr:unnamed protein product [Angiostrongylus costaricensis]
MDRSAITEPTRTQPLSSTLSTNDDLTPKHSTMNGRIVDAKKTAEGLAGLYDSDDDKADVKAGGLDALFLVRNKPEEIERYVIHLRKMLLEGEGETVVELGVPIELGGKASGIPTKDLDVAVANHVKALASIPAIEKILVYLKRSLGKAPYLAPKLLQLLFLWDFTLTLIFNVLF